MQLPGLRKIVPEKVDQGPHAAGIAVAAQRLNPLGQSERPLPVPSPQAPVGGSQGMLPLFFEDEQQG
jgi:hypothetical protein